jgi:mono/diheme cytochrome c family protein
MHPARAIVVAVGLLLAVQAVTADRAQTTPAVAVRAPQAPRAVLEQYCVTCHNQRLSTAGLAIDAIDFGSIRSHADTLERMVRKLRTRTMPPPGVPHPGDAALADLASWLETELDGAWATSPEPARPRLHRLNRTEYAYAIRDLLALEIDATSLLPADDSSYGFDNVADVLGTSPVLMEQYLSAARKISAMAIGDPSIAPGAETYRVRHDASQHRHVDGMPLGTIGGIKVRHYFPLDGEYTFQVKLFRTNLNAIRGLEHPSDIEIAVDGTRVFLGSVGGEADLKALFENPSPNSDRIDARLQVTIPVKAGPHEVTAAFLEKPPVGNSLHLQSFLRSSADPLDFTGWPHVASLTVAGPFKATGPGDTPSRRRVFVCYPADEKNAEACARRILGDIARLAYRGFVTSADVDRLMTFYRDGRRDIGFDAGIQMALRRVLVSPKFLVRTERQPRGALAGGPYAISDLELASRLSFFLWSSIPDDELLQQAEAGRLGNDAMLEQQVRRMLADRRARALVENFAGQWLHLRNLRNIVPNSELFPDFDDNLRQALLREAELFVESVIREDRSALDLLTADHSFVNERLAQHYGLRGVYGSQHRRVRVPSERAGLLGKGAVLLVTSHADRTSPVLRGKWILENILGIPPAPPPPDVPALEETDGGRPRTMREQMEHHRASPVCASCHKLMDPLGLALENFDAVGAWRTHDAGQPIDPSTQLGDGSTVDGIGALRTALVSNPDVFVGTLTEKVMIYALGRGLRAQDMPSIRRIVRDARDAGFRFSAIVSGVVRSQPFRMRLGSEE